MLETWLRESRVRLPATSQLCFCSLTFVDHVLILHDYQMAFIRHAVDNSCVIAGYSLNFP